MNYDHEEYDYEDELKDAAVLIIICVGGFLAIMCVCVALIARSV